MTHQSILYIIGLLLVAIPLFVKAVQWYNARLEKRGEMGYETRIKDEFIFDVAVNHLPHIESSLELIARHLNIDLPEPPPIKWLPYDPSKK